MPPTDEQVRRMGGFQTPSLTSTIEPYWGGYVGIVSSPSLSAIPNMEIPRSEFVQSKGVSTSPSKLSFVPIAPNDEVGSPDLPEQAGSISVELGVYGNEGKPPKEIDGMMPHHDSEWITEVSWTEQDKLEAAELEKRADAAFIAQMSALRTYNWVSNTHGLGSSITPPGQIQSSVIDRGEIAQDGGYGGSSTSETPSETHVSNDEGRVEEDPFETPPYKRSPPPKGTLSRPLARSFMPDSSTMWIARRRDRQLLPCAYRSRTEAGLLFNALQHEVRINEQPHRRSSEPETESEHFSRLFKTPHIDGTKHDRITLLGILKILCFDDLLNHFDTTIDEILEDVKAANERYFNHAKGVLIRGLDA